MSESHWVCETIVRPSAARLAALIAVPAGSRPIPPGLKAAHNRAASQLRRAERFLEKGRISKAEFQRRAVEIQSRLEREQARSQQAPTSEED